MKRIINYLKKLNYKNLFRVLGLELFTLITQTFFIWVTGLFLIKYLACLNFFNPLEMLLIVMWIRIINYQLKKITLKNIDQ